MAEKRLRTIEFRGLGTTYTIPEVDPTSSVTGNAADAKVVGDHIKDKDNPHGVTADQIGAAPSGYGLGGQISMFIDPSIRLSAITTGGMYYWNSENADPEKPFTSGELLVIPRGGAGYFDQIAFGKDTTVPKVKIRQCLNVGSWSAWEDWSPSAFALASHSQAASTITGGTFAGPVYASNTAQAPITSQLRNSSIAASERTPSNNGEICWVCE